MLTEKVEVELGIACKGVLHIFVEVYRQEAAAVVGAEGNLAAGIGGDGAEAQVGVAVGDALTQNRVPEQHTRLSALPGIVHDLAPQGAGIDFLGYDGVVAVDGELLHVGFAFGGSLHEGIVDLHAHVGAGDLALSHLGVDKSLSIGVFDADTEHQSSAAAVLSHLTGAVAIALHERDEARAGEGGVLHRSACGAQVGEVVHAATAFHQLHLFLVDADNGTVRIGVAIQSHHKAVGQRSHLIVVADAGHRRARRDNVFEMVEKVEDLLGRHGILVFLLDAGHFVGDAPVHIFRTLLVDIAIGVLHRILVYPHAGCQFITAEIS